MISVALPNCVEYPLIVLGGAAAQCVISPVNAAYTDTELRGLIEASSAKMVVTNAEHYEKIKEATDAIQNVRIMLIDSTNGKKDVLNLAEVINMTTDSSCLPEDSAGDGDSVFLLPFSSGTTGKPKGVMLTHRNCIANIVQMEPLQMELEGKTNVLIMPMFHAGGMKTLLPSC